MIIDWNEFYNVKITERENTEWLCEFAMRIDLFESNRIRSNKIKTNLLILGMNEQDYQYYLQYTLYNSYYLDEVTFYRIGVIICITRVALFNSSIQSFMIVLVE